MWLYAHSHVNYLVNFTSDIIRCLAFPGGREARDSEPDRRARRGVGGAILNLYFESTRFQYLIVKMT